MKHALTLEAIGDNHDGFIRFSRKSLDTLLGKGFGDEIIGRPPKSYWVAEIVGLDDRYGFSRKFLPYHKDYSKANSVGSRGVMVHYTVEDGPIYEVLSPQTWNWADRYFCRYEDGAQIRMTKAEVMEWLEKSGLA